MPATSFSPDFAADFGDGGLPIIQANPLRTLAVAPRIRLLKVAGNGMAYAGEFTPVTPSEIVPLSLDFDADLLEGEAIAAVTWACSDDGGTGSIALSTNPVPTPTPDPNANTRISASSFLGTIVTAKVSGQLDGAYYRLKAVITTSLANAYEAFGDVMCKAGR